MPHARHYLDHIVYAVQVSLGYGFLKEVELFDPSELLKVIFEYIDEVPRAGCPVPEFCEEEDSLEGDDEDAVVH